VASSEVKPASLECPALIDRRVETDDNVRSGRSTEVGGGIGTNGSVSAINFQHFLRISIVAIEAIYQNASIGFDTIGKRGRPKPYQTWLEELTIDDGKDVWLIPVGTPEVRHGNDGEFRPISAGTRLCSCAELNSGTSLNVQHLYIGVFRTFAVQDDIIAGPTGNFRISSGDGLAHGGREKCPCGLALEFTRSEGLKFKGVFRIFGAEIYLRPEGPFSRVNGVIILVVLDDSGVAGLRRFLNLFESLSERHLTRGQDDGEGDKSGAMKAHGSSKKEGGWCYIGRQSPNMVVFEILILSTTAVSIIPFWIRNRKEVIVFWYLVILQKTGVQYIGNGLYVKRFLIIYQFSYDFLIKNTSIDCKFLN